MSNYFNEFVKTALKHQNNDAVIFPICKKGKLIGEKRYLYKEIVKHIQSANEIITAKNKKRKPVGLLLSNSPLFPSAFLSILSADFIVVPVYPSATREVIEKILSDNEIKVIISDRKHNELFKRFDFKNLVILNIEDIISSGKEVVLKSFKTINDVAIISYTSGTSGVPKGALITNKNIVFVTQKYCELYKLNLKSRVLAALPLWHNYGMFAALLSNFLIGGSVIFLDKWSSQIAMEIICKYKVTVFPGSPFMYIDMVNDVSKTYDMSSLKVCDSGGYSLPVEYIKRFEKKTGAIITEGYGLTETTSLTHFNYSAIDRKVGSIGKAIPEVICKIVNNDGKKAKVEEYGLLWVKGPMVCKGYSNLKSLNFRNSWFNTGDIVKIDSSGNYFIAGRLSDVKQVGVGDSSFPRYIEEILYEFKGVVRVYARRNLKNNQSYDLFVILKDVDYRPGFVNFLKSNLPDIKFDKIFYVKKMPVTGTGKIRFNSING